MSTGKELALPVVFPKIEFQFNFFSKVISKYFAYICKWNCYLSTIFQLPFSGEWHSAQFLRVDRHALLLTSTVYCCQDQQKDYQSSTYGYNATFRNIPLVQLQLFFQSLCFWPFLREMLTIYCWMLLSYRGIWLPPALSRFSKDSYKPNAKLLRDSFVNLPIHKIRLFNRKDVILIILSDLRNIDYSGSQPTRWDTLVCHLKVLWSYEKSFFFLGVSPPSSLLGSLDRILFIWYTLDVEDRIATPFTFRISLLYLVRTVL